MIDDVISRAKYLQDEENKEISLFQPDILKFQTDLVESIKSFVNLAIEKEITGVSFEELNDIGKGVREFSFQIDDVDLVLVMRKEIYPIGFDGKKIGNLAYLYSDGDISFTPRIEISTYRDLTYPDSTKAKFISASWFSTNEKKPLSGDLPLNEKSVVEIAEIIIRSFYNYNKCWKEAPSREDFRSNKNKKGKMGFLAEQP